MRNKVAWTMVSAVLLCMLYGIIFSFSAQDGEQSGGLSQLISVKYVEFINTLSGKKWSQLFVENMAEYFEHPIRKLAHFTEYACMGVLVYSMWRPWKERGRRLCFLTIVWVFLSAAADEFHQLYVPGRYGSMADVLLDTCGGAFGVWMSTIIEKCIRRRR